MRRVASTPGANGAASLRQPGMHVVGAVTFGILGYVVVAWLADRAAWIVTWESAILALVAGVLVCSAALVPRTGLISGVVAVALVGINQAVVTWWSAPRPDLRPFFGDSINVVVLVVAMCVVGASLGTRRRES